MTEYKVDEFWYVLRRGAFALIKVYVNDITEHTVEIVECKMHANPERYKKGFVEFVERLPMENPPMEGDV